MANLKLGFEHTIITNEDLLNYTKNKEQLNGYNIAVDEIHLWFNSRRSMSKKSIIFSYMIGQMRKKGNFLFYTSQTMRKPDVILREETDIFHFPEMMIDIGNMNLKRFNSVMYDEIPKELHDLLYVKDRIVVKKIISGMEHYTEKVRYFKASEIFGLYDTKYVIGFE